MACCGGCLCVVVTITVLSLSGTLLGSGITDLTGRDGEQLAQLDGGQLRWTAIWTITFGAIGLLLLLLTGVSLLSQSWIALLISVLSLVGMFIMVRFDDIAKRVPGGDLDNIAAAMNTSISRYTEDPTVEMAWDFAQWKLHCCGINNASDWAHLLGDGLVPASCCRGQEQLAATNCSVARGAYTQGCAGKMHDFIGNRRTWSVAVATAAASLILLLLADSLACLLCEGGGGPPGYAPLPSSGVSRSMQAALNNRANQLNPNNWRYQGRR